MKEDLKKKLMSDMWAKGIDLGVIIKSDTPEEMSDMEDEMPTVDLMSHLEDMKHMLMAATPEEKLDFLYWVLEACKMDKEDGEEVDEEEVVDWASIDESVMPQIV